MVRVCSLSNPVTWVDSRLLDELVADVCSLPTSAEWLALVQHPQKLNGSLHVHLGLAGLRSDAKDGCGKPCSAVRGEYLWGWPSGRCDWWYQIGKGWQGWSVAEPSCRFQSYFVFDFDCCLCCFCAADKPLRLPLETICTSGVPFHILTASVAVLAWKM
jgi:hypothetical protein